ncbi:MAG: Sua5/YciO/YrdC/YwlC family protein, partial [Candidatus Diapherotrites archaeon]|nr:Sua5/YciO/YrdC/YwlC family protein [Candidatus Diapherotrites archaeon]
ILAKEFFPGPLNIVVPLKEKVPENLARGTIAFRVPRNRFARALCKELGGPVTATSANTHGETPIFDAEEATQKFFEKVDLIIDSGGLPERPASTIYSIIEHKVLREGEIKKETIKAALW